MRLRTQKIALADTVRVEIAFEIDKPEPTDLAVLAYDDPVLALVDACAFVETALAAVREHGARLAAGRREEITSLEQDWKRTMGDKA